MAPCDQAGDATVLSNEGICPGGWGPACAEGFCSGGGKPDRARGHAVAASGGGGGGEA